MAFSVLDLLFPLSAPVSIDASALVPVREQGAGNIDLLVAGCSYRSSAGMRAMLHLFKYRRMSRLAACFAEALDRACDLLPAGERTLCPVPLHWSRLFDRGFNQSELLAHVLASRRGWRVAHLLRRSRSTGRQAQRDRAGRMTAMLGAFKAERVPMPASVLLVDDVATTLATLDACAAALKGAGVRRVDAVVVARR